MSRLPLRRMELSALAAIILCVSAIALAKDNNPAAFSKAIEKLAVSLGYPQNTAADLVRLAQTWNCDQWRQKLAQARSAAGANSAEIAGVEEQASRWLYQTLVKEISPAPASSKYFNLAAVIKDQKAQCVGYTQLLWCLGNAIGLSVRPIDVLAPLNSGTVGHVSCLVDLADGKTMMVDPTRRLISSPFDFKKTFTADRNDWLRNKSLGDEIPQRIQILDADGLAACAYCDVGMSYSSVGNRDKAISCFTKASELAPKLSDPYLNRGVEYRRQNRFDDALNDFNKAIDLDPKCYLALLNRGAMFSQVHKSEEAIADFTAAINVDPKFADAYLARGVEFASHGQFDVALRDLTTKIELDPKDYASFYNRAKVYKALSRLTEALADSDRAIQLNPKSLESYCLRGNIYGEKQEFAKAIAEFDKAIEVSPRNALAYMNRGATYALMNKAEQASADLRKAAQLDPSLANEIKALAQKLKLTL